MSDQPCPGCGQICSVDSTGTEVFCTGCGTLVGDNSLTEEVEFVRSSGGTSAGGQFIGASGGVNHFGIVRAAFGRKSREVTVAVARNVIRTMSNALKIPEDVQAVAVNFYKMALTRNLTMGRSRPLVFSSCLYMACRIEGSSLMLADFADLMKVPVFDLGTYFLSLSNKLCLKMPTTDPCLYVFRFCHALNYGEKAHRIGTTASRILARMKTDWIDVGRKPSGLCGAAIFIAGQLHEDGRTIKEIVKVVKVHHATLRKRLKEFGETGAAALTVDKFLSPALENLPAESEPPIVKEQRAEAGARMNVEEQTGASPDLAVLDGIEMSTFQQVYKEIARLLEVKAPKPNAEVDSVEDGASRVGFWHEFVQTLEIGCQEENVDIMKFLREENAAAIPGADEATSALEDCAAPECKNPGDLDVKSPASPAPLPRFLQLEHPHKCEKAQGLAQSTSGELDVEGLDEAELDNYILSPAEAALKTKLWVKLNAEYIRLQVQKRKLEEEGVIPKKKRKKAGSRRTHAGTRVTDTNDAGESVKQMLARKKLCKLINLDVLDELEKRSFAGANLPTSAVSTDVKPDVAAGEENEIEKVGCKKPVLRKETAGVPLGVLNTSENDWPVKANENDVKSENVVPVEPKKGEKTEPVEDFIDDEDEEDVDEEPSAALLLRQFSACGEEEANFLDI